MKKGKQRKKQILYENKSLFVGLRLRQQQQQLKRHKSILIYTHILMNYIKYRFDSIQSVNLFNFPVNCQLLLILSTTGDILCKSFY